MWYECTYQGKPARLQFVCPYFQVELVFVSNCTFLNWNLACMDSISILLPLLSIVCLYPISNITLNIIKPLYLLVSIPFYSHANGQVLPRKLYHYRIYFRYKLENQHFQRIFTITWCQMGPWTPAILWLKGPAICGKPCSNTLRAAVPETYIEVWSRDCLTLWGS